MSPSANGEGPRFVRRSMSPAALSILVPVYQFNPYPNRAEYEHISTTIQLESDRIKNWFNNRRRKDIRSGVLCQPCRYFKAPLTPHQHMNSGELRPCYRFYYPAPLNHQLVPIPQPVQMVQQPLKSQEDHEADGSLVIDESVDNGTEVSNENVVAIQQRPVFHQQSMMANYCNRPGCFCFQGPSIQNYAQMAPPSVEPVPSNWSDQSNRSRCSPESNSNGSSASSQWTVSPPLQQEFRPIIPANWQPPSGAYPLTIHRQESFTQVVKYHPYFNPQHESNEH